MVNKVVYIGFSLVPISMTLNDRNAPTYPIGLAFPVLAA